jgi:HTH-type transcriptional regulator/antitoxin HipB
MRVANVRDLGNLVRDRRRQLNLTQTELAVRAKVSRRWLSELEAGKQSTDFGLVLRTLRALGLVVDVEPEESLAPIDLDAVLARHRDGS